MSILDIVTIPDPLLKTISKPVAAVDDDLRKLMDDMLETMYAAPGIGLAAIQIGVAKRVLVMDLEGEPDALKPLYMVNPEVLWASEEMHIYNEGCLSVPEQYADVERPRDIKIKYLDYHGNMIEEEMTGLHATCVQHEIDHLNGIVFIDHISRLKREMIVKKMIKLSKDAKAL
jgi:peptide deformylase